MKVFKRVLIGLALFFVVFLVAAYVTVKVAFPPEKVRALIHDQGSEILGREVSVGGVSVRVFPRIKIAVTKVTLANDSGFSAEPAVTLESLDLSISFWSLLRFSPVINEIRLVKPDILFEVDTAGHNNLESLGGSDTAKKEEDSVLTLPTNVALKAFIIEGGRVRYRDAGARREVTLGRIDQRASLSVDKHLRDVRTQGLLEISEISLQDSGLGVRTGGIKVTVSHDVRVDLPGDSIRINSVEVSFQDVKAKLDGLVTGMLSPSPRVDIHLAAPSVSLASLLKEIPEGLSPEIRKFRAAGTASLDARVKGVIDSVSTPDIFADVTVREGAFGHADVPQGVEKFTVDLKVRHDSLNLERLTFVTGPNPIQVTALATSILDSIPQLRSLKVEGSFDLGNLSGLARAMGLLDSSLRVTGVQTLQLQASGPVDAARPERLAVSGKSESKNVRALMTGFPPVTVNGVADFSNEKIRERMQARIGNSDAAVDAEVAGYLALVFPDRVGAKRPRVRVDVKSSLIDLDEFLGLGTAEEEASDPLTEYPEWPPVDADVTVALARTRLLGLEMTAFSLKSALREKSAQTDLKGTLYSGGFSSSLGLVPRNKKDIGVALKLKVAQVEANDFISRLNDHVPLRNKLLKSLAGTDNSIFGKFNLDLDVATGGLPDAFADRATGTAAFSVTDGKLVGIEWTKSLSAALAKAHSSLGFQEFNFSELKGDFVIQSGKLIVKDLGFDGTRAGSAHAMGTIGFDNSLNLTLTQTLPAAASRQVEGGSGALLGAIAKATGSKAVSGSLLPTDKNGNTLLYYLVRGDVTGPSFALDAKRMAAEGASGAAAGAAKAAANAKLQEEKAKLQAQAQAEREKLEAAAKAKIETEKKKATEEAKKKGKKVLKDMGF